MEASAYVRRWEKVSGRERGKGKGRDKTTEEYKQTSPISPIKT